jgi:hypothetical protein
LSNAGNPQPPNLLRAAGDRPALVKLTPSLVAGRFVEADVCGHAKVRVKFGTKTVSVDVGMKRLLKALWARRIRTFSECQEDSPGLALVSFNGLQAAQRFLRLA